MSEGSPDLERLDELLSRGFGPEGEAEDAHFGLQLAVAGLHRGELAFERYGKTADASTELISWSMAKSMTQALVGLLMMDGLIEPTAPAAVPEWANDERAAITLQHLLEMTSGLEFVEDYVDDQVSHVIEMLFGAGKADVAGYAASFPLQHEPGTVFNYSSGTTNIISAICGRIIAEANDGEDVASFLQRRLFGPLGMENTRIQCDDAGTFIGSSFVFAPARDFLKFGQLYLQDGVWDGQRLLPEGWMDHARTPIEPPVTDAHWYGGHWWLWDDNCDPAVTGLETADIGGFGCHGFEGQYIVVVPGRDLVVCRLGKTPVEQQPEVRSWLADIIRCFPSS